MTLGEAVRRRRLMHAYRDRAAANARLTEASSAFRRRAQEQVDAGRPELARPYLEEADLFDSAVRALPAL